MPRLKFKGKFFFFLLLTVCLQFFCLQFTASIFFFFFNDTATTEIYTLSYTLSLHGRSSDLWWISGSLGAGDANSRCASWAGLLYRSEEHTSELQSHSEISYAVFCLKKKK